MASERVEMLFFSRQESIAESCSFCQRMPICMLLPVVAGRRRLFIGVPIIDLPINPGGFSYFEKRGGLI
jgi:hypothetical protein